MLSPGPVPGFFVFEGPTVTGMPSVRVKENEYFDAALRRFKRACEKAGVLTELRRREPTKFVVYQRQQLVGSVCLSRVDSREYPSPMKFVAEARRDTPDVWIDIEKPFWWDVPTWLASGKMNSMWC